MPDSRTAMFCRASRGVVVVLALMALTACGHKQKIQECRTLISVINDGVAKIEQRIGSPAEARAAVAELRALGDGMDAVARAAAEAPISIAELKKLSVAYQEMATAVAAAARELATAVDKVDLENVTKAQKRMDDAVKREDPIVEGVNQLCQNP